MNDTQTKPSKFQSWILASRPKTLLAAFVPVFVGTAVAVEHQTENILAAITALLCSILIQVATNFVNDLYDYLSGKDTAERKGPTRALAAGWITTSQMKAAIIITFGLAFLLGLYLVYIGGITILVIGIISIAAGIAYTAGPYPLAYNGLGDLFVFLFFGVVATCGTYFVQSGEINIGILLTSIPIGLLITNILVVNNYRDIDEDRKNNKNTLAVKLGKSFTKAQYTVSLILSYSIIIYLSLYTNSYLLLLPLLTIPLAVIQIKELFSLSGTKLNNLLAGTARFSFIFGLLLSVGYLL